MKNETFDPNKLTPSQVAGLALTDPKLKLTNCERKMLMRNRETRLGDSWLKYNSDGRPIARREAGPAPKSEGDRWVGRLAVKPMAQLIRFVKKSARRSASCMYAIRKADAQGVTGPFIARLPHEQNRQLALMRAGLRMIESRVNPQVSNEI